MSKPGRQLDREIQEALGLPPEIVKRWRSKVAAYKRAVANMEAGYSDAGHLAMARARDALDDMIYKAAGHVPYVAGQPAHLSPAIVALTEERKKLVSDTWERAQERGREANDRARREELRKLDEQIRDERRPYEWMRGR